FYDSARAIQTKTIMTLGDFPKGFASPILRVRIKARLWLAECEKELVVTDFSTPNNYAFPTIMAKCIHDELAKYFLQKLWINIQHRVSELNVPRDFGAFLGQIVLDMAA